MAYGTKYRAQTKTAQNADLHEIEIQQVDYSGEVTDVRLNAGEGGYKHIYENLDPKDLYSEPVQKSRLKVFLQVRSESHDESLGYDGISILKEIYDADEKEYKIVKKINGNVDWQGYVLPDMLSLKKKWAFAGQIVAKDFTSLAENPYQLYDLSSVPVERTPIEIIRLILQQQLGFEQNIITYTNWEEEESSNIYGSAGDVLSRVYLHEKQLVKQVDDETGEEFYLNNLEALKYVLKSFGCILRQSEGKFKIYQLSAFEDPTAVNRYEYDIADNTQLSATTVDLSTTIDNDERYVANDYDIDYHRAFKRVLMQFDQKSALSDIRFPDSFEATRTFSSEFGYDSGHDIYLQVTGHPEYDQQVVNPRGLVEMKLTGHDDNGNQAQKWWDGDSWIDTQTDLELGSNYSTDPYDFGDTYRGFFSSEIKTGQIPDNFDKVYLTFKSCYGTDSHDGSTVYALSDNYEAHIDIDGDDDAVSIEYQLEQPNAFSSEYDYQDILWSDSVSGIETAYIRYKKSYGSGTTGTYLTGKWRYEGDASWISHQELLLKTILNPSRAVRQSVDTDVYGRYELDQIIDFNDIYHFFLGGEYTLYSDTWSSRLMELSIEDGADTFSEVASVEGSSTSSTSGSTISGQDLSGQYFSISNALSEGDAPDIRDNIDVYSIPEADNKFLDPSNVINVAKEYENAGNLGDKLKQAISDITKYSVIDATGVEEETPSLGYYVISDTVDINISCKILLPSGTVKFISSDDEPMFRISANSVIVEGVGRSASMDVSSTVTKLVMDANSPNNYHFFGRGINVITLTQMDLIGVRTTDQDAVWPNLDGTGGIYLEKPNPGTTSGGNNVNKAIFDELYIEGTMAHGIYIDTPILSRMANVRVSKAGGHGIYIHKGTSMSLKNIYVSSAHKGGIAMYQHSYSSLINCVAEYAGVGFWFRSCNAINVFASGTEMCQNKGQTVPNTDIPTTDEDGNEVIISDVGPYEMNFWRGNSYAITGGENITLINPYSTNPGQHYENGYSSQSRHFLLWGPAENINIINPSTDIASGKDWGGRFDIEIGEYGSKPTNTFIKWNPLDGTKDPNGGRVITDNNDSTEAMPILNEGVGTIVWKGDTFYSLDFPEGNRVFQETINTKGIDIDNNPFVDIDRNVTANDVSTGTATLTTGGSASSPAVKLNSGNSGFFDNGINSVAVTSGGTVVADFNSGESYFKTPVTFEDKISPIYIDGGGSASSPAIKLNSGNTGLFDNGPNSLAITSGGTTVVDFQNGEGYFKTHMTFEDDVEVDGKLTATIVETDVLKTTLFHYDEITATGAKSAITDGGTIQGIVDSNTFTVDNPTINNGDYVLVSGFTSSGFATIRAEVTGKNGHDYTLSNISGGLSNIEKGMSIVRANGDMIVMDASGGSGGIPSIAGYDDVAKDFNVSPLTDGSADPNWEITQDFIYYDGLMYTIYSPLRVAEYGGLQAGDPAGDEWDTSASNGSTGGTSEHYMDIIRDKFLLRHGVNYIQVTFYGKINAYSSGADNYTGTGKVRITVDGQSTFQDFDNGSYGGYQTVTLNVSDIPNGFQDIKVELGAMISSDGAATCDVDLRSDLLVTAQATL